MSLIDMLSNRGSISAASTANSKSPLAMRGERSWRSGFEGMQNAALMELLRAFREREQAANALTFPIAKSQMSGRG